MLLSHDVSNTMLLSLLQCVQHHGAIPVTCQIPWHGAIPLSMCPTPWCYPSYNVSNTMVLSLLQCVQHHGAIPLTMCPTPWSLLQCHGWEIAVILRNFRKTKLSKSKFLFLYIFFYYSISTCTQCATRRLSLCDIRKYRFPAFHGTSPAKPPSSFSFAHAWYKQFRAWNSSRKRGFSRKWKSKMAEKIFFRGKQIHKHTLFFKQSVGVAESMEITREWMRVCQQNRALMELSFVDICIFQAISVTEVYGRSWLVKKVC